MHDICVVDITYAAVSLLIFSQHFVSIDIFIVNGSDVYTVTRDTSS